MNRKSILAAIVIASGAATAAMAEFTQEAGDVLVLVNELRMSGATCTGTGTTWGPTEPFALSEGLFTVAHEWSRAMVQMDRLSHDGFAARIGAVCANPGVIAENIAGNPAARGAVEGWMASPSGHCEAIMNPDHKVVGVGMAYGGQYGAYWTMKFAGNC
jgi:uncharacterized protein YkwD